MSKLTLSFKSKVLKVYPVLKGSMVIGSDPASTIQIDSLAVQPQHAQIDTVNADSVIRDLGTEEGTFLNSAKLEGLKPLKDGDVIRVGKHVLTYTYAENMTSEQDAIAEALVEEESPIQMESKEKKQGWLQIMSGSNLGKTMSLNRAMTNLGKPGLSTAVITKRGDGYFISHLEGKITPLVKNKEIGDKSLPLSDGDTIQIGNIKMQFYLE